MKSSRIKFAPCFRNNKESLILTRLVVIYFYIFQ